MKIACDFETLIGDKTLDKKYRKTEVWLACFANIEDYSDFSKFNVTFNIKDFFINLISYIENNRKNEKEITCFFHNLRFDGSFIMNFLLKNNIACKTFINNQGIWYSIILEFSNYKIVFRDSLKILNFRLSQLAGLFKMPIAKGTTPLLEFRPDEIKPEWLEYVKTDVAILAKAIYEMYITEKFKKYTSASEALYEFKNTVEYRELFPILPKEIDSFLRQSYRGGWTFCNPIYQNTVINKKIKVFDINSMYPAVMLENPLPYGTPIYNKGKPNLSIGKYQIIKVWLNLSLKKNHLPTLQTKDLKTALEIGIRTSDYITTTNDELYCFTLTNFDLIQIMKHYYVHDIVYDSYYEFKSKKGIFDYYITKYKDLKENAKTPTEKHKAKIMLNSLYGKFGSKIISISKKPYLVDNVLKFEEEPPEEVEPNYIAIAIFITSIARFNIISDAQKNYFHFLYADTDSLHLLDNDKINLKIDKSKFGLWKEEGIFQRAKYLRSKLYIEEVYNPLKKYKKNIVKSLKRNLILGKFGIIQVKGAGMTNEVKKQVTFKNFEFGSTFIGKRSMQVYGGVIIYDSEFTLQDNKLIG